MGWLSIVLGGFHLFPAHPEAGGFPHPSPWPIFSGWVSGIRRISFPPLCCRRRAGSLDNPGFWIFIYRAHIAVLARAPRFRTLSCAGVAFWPAGQVAAALCWDPWFSCGFSHRGPFGRSPGFGRISTFPKYFHPAAAQFHERTSLCTITPCCSPGCGICCLKIAVPCLGAA